MSPSSGSPPIEHPSCLFPHLSSFCTFMSRPPTCPSSFLPPPPRHLVSLLFTSSPSLLPSSSLDGVGEKSQGCYPSQQCLGDRLWSLSTRKGWESTEDSSCTQTPGSWGQMSGHHNNPQDTSLRGLPSPLPLSWRACLACTRVPAPAP